jgi:hypothetical protein
MKSRTAAARSRHKQNTHLDQDTLLLDTERLVQVDDLVSLVKGLLCMESANDQQVCLGPPMNVPRSPRLTDLYFHVPIQGHVSKTQWHMTNQRFVLTGVEREAGVDLGRDTSGNDLQDLASERDEKTVHGVLGLGREVTEVSVSWLDGCDISWWL